MQFGRLGPYVEGVLQRRFKYERGSGNYGRDQDQEMAYGHPARNVVATAHNKKEVGFCREQKNDEEQGAVSYRAQGSYGVSREHFVPADVSEQRECLVQRHEKRNGRQVRAHKEWIIEIDLEERGVHVSSLKVGFPQHEGESADTEEHSNGLKEYHWDSLHSGQAQPNDPIAMKVR